MRGIQPGDGDRLPWLEPYREVMAQKGRAARRSHGGLAAYAGALILLIAAAGAGFWFGQRSDQAPAPQPSATIALPPPKPAPPPIPVAEATPAPEPAQTVAGPVEAEKPKPVKQAAKKRSTPRKKIRSAGTQRSRYEATRAAQERRALNRPWPRMPSPGPPGQVIQLGAFSTAARASNAYQARTARYPLLATMPRVIVPVVSKPDGRVLYVLRLGTTSRQQSKTVCRNLRRSGDHCLVIG